MPNFASISLFCRPLAAKNLQFLPIFAIFWTSAFSVVANWPQSDKVEHGCTTTNRPLPNGIKIVSVLQRLHGEIGRTNSDVQKRDGQTDKQTKILNVFGHPGGETMRQTRKRFEMKERARGPLSPCQVWWGSDFTRRRGAQKR